MKYKSYIFFFILFALFLFISLNRDSKAKTFTYHSELWADKAGYHIYLPYFLVYRADSRNLPDSIDIKTGNGFRIDSLNGKLQTKYTYGTALLQCPFYLANLFAEKKPFQEFDAFSHQVQRTINVAACFYALLGLFLLYSALRYYDFSSVVVWFGLSTIFLTTNLVYYSLFECGMSHVYSFFAFALLVWSSTNRNVLMTFFWQGLSVGLILIIRPVNIIYVPFVLSFFSTDLHGLFKRIFSFFNPISIFTILILVIPQLLYWKFAFGSWLYYSYGNEGFTYLLHPPLLRFLFSPNNGLLLYAPIMIVIIVGIFITTKNSPHKLYSLLICLVLFVWITSGWWIWNYGCSYGCRPFVELLSVFSFPMCALIGSIKNRSLGFLFILLIVLLICVNLKFIYSYDVCWLYGDWDYKMYFKMLFGPTN